MKFSMCKRGLCTHWLIWLFRKWVGIETMKLWVQWLWGEGSYRSILLLFGRSLDVSCLIHGYYTRLLYTVTIHTNVEAAVLYTVTIHTSHVLYRRLLYILLLKLPARLWSPPRLNDCAANATVRDRFDIEKFLARFQEKKKTSSLLSKPSYDKVTKHESFQSLFFEVFWSNVFYTSWTKHLCSVQVS